MVNSWMVEDTLPIDKIIQGDTLQVLKTFPDDCIDCIITSPPYWGLRDYGEQTNMVWDGDPNCKHEWNIKKIIREASSNSSTLEGGKDHEIRQTINTKSGFCSKCGAWYGQLGLEPTLELYLEHMLQITSELKRVLKPTGVMFWNHSDSYSAKSTHANKKKVTNYDNLNSSYGEKTGRIVRYEREFVDNIPAKSLCFQNYRLILRMIDEQGWILRNIIIWHKPNHMPSSVKDRFTNSYEPVFMLTKNKRYWFDLDAVRIPHKMESIKRAARGRKSKKLDSGQYATSYKCDYVGYDDLEGKLERGELRGTHPMGKNPGDLWTIPTQPFPEAHFATFPEKLVEPMIKAGCPEWICKRCGKPRARIVGIEKTHNRENKRPDANVRPDNLERPPPDWKPKDIKFIGWSDCGCNAGWKPGIVLDPFAGSGTTLYTARKLNRHYIGIELNLNT